MRLHVAFLRISTVPVAAFTSQAVGHSFVEFSPRWSGAIALFIAPFLSLFVALFVFLVFVIVFLFH